MRTKKLGRTGEEIPAIGQGTWKMGHEMAADILALKAGIEAGMRFIDTAEMYGSEPVVREAALGEDVFIATKVSPSHFSHDAVIKACDQSLKKLGVKRIDLYQLHWPNPSIPIEETMGAMEELVSDGKIRYIGISNFSVDQTIEAQHALKSNEIVSNQVEYNLLSRGIEDELLDYCRKEGITLIAYSPFARGEMFDGRYKAQLGLLAEIGNKYGVTPAQVALNWLISKAPVVAIPKAASRDHAMENAAAAGFELTKNEVDRIGSAFE